MGISILTVRWSMEMEREEMKLNLEACGCDRKTIACFCSEEREKQLEMLSLQRQALLEKVHEEERKISCLDYMVYRMEKDES